MSWFANEDFWKDLYDWLFSEARFRSAKEEVERILALTNVRSGNVLDLCCGPGRHSYEFARLGFNVVGVDASKFLLNKANELCLNLSNVELVHADMRDFVRPNHFDLVINVFTSFGYFEDQDDNMKVLRNIKKSLKSSGKLLMEMVSKEVLLRNYRDSVVSEQGSKMLVEKHSFEPGMARMRNQWIVLEAGEYKVYSLQHYVYSGQELKMMLQMCGFTNVELYGSLDGTAYDLNAKRLVVVAS
ncbi:class I SAM-dependent methyltransferase [Pseudothermotoga sp.]